MVESLRGWLIVATPALDDPNFDRTVILILEHEPGGGAMGLVLNRPSGLGLDPVLNDWAALATPPAEIFLGGPVEPDVAVVLGWLMPHAPVPPGMQAVFDRVGVVDLTRSPEDLADLVAIRVYAGYAGWSPGQLEHEVEQGAWFTLAADTWDAATAEPHQLWHEVLRRQPDRRRLLATFPDDPALN